MHRMLINSRDFETVVVFDSSREREVRYHVVKKMMQRYLAGEADFRDVAYELRGFSKDGSYAKVEAVRDSRVFDEIVSTLGYEVKHRFRNVTHQRVAK